MKTIARYYLKEIRRVQPRGPYYLGGYCIGGLVAFEMAQQLRAAEEEVECLVLFEPDLAPSRGTLKERMQLALDEAAVLSACEKLRYFSRRITSKVQWKLGGLQAAASDLIQSLYSALNKGSETTVERLEAIKLRVLRMLMRAQSNYMARAYPGRIILFVVAGSDNGQLAHDRGWNELAQDGIEIHEIPGEHDTIFQSRYVAMLAGKLDACLRAGHSRRETPRAP
jgi:thioesterase domain-containing protein